MGLLDELEEFVSDPIDYIEDQGQQALDEISNFGEELEEFGEMLGDFAENAAKDIITLPFQLLGDIFDALGLMPELPEPEKGILVNKSSNVEDIPIVYGSRRIGGIRAFVGVNGASNEYLHVILILCEGDIEAIDDVYIDDIISTDAKFTGKLEIRKYTGEDWQAADSTLSSDFPEWTSNHKLSGVSYIVCRFRWDEEGRAYSGFPRINVDVRGKKVLDPRNGKLEHSANPALCILDYLLNARYGRGIERNQIENSRFEDGTTTGWGLPGGSYLVTVTDGICTIDRNGDASVNSMTYVVACEVGKQYEFRFFISFNNSYYSVYIDGVSQIEQAHELGEAYFLFTATSTTHTIQLRAVNSNTAKFSFTAVSFIDGRSAINYESFKKSAYYCDLKQPKNIDSINQSLTETHILRPISPRPAAYFGYIVGWAKDSNFGFVTASDYGVDGDIQQGACYAFDLAQSRQIQLIQPSMVTNYEFSAAFNSISNDGLVLCVPDVFDSTQASSAGAATIWEYDPLNDSYSETAQLYAPNPSANDHFGSNTAVSGDGSTVFVSAHEYQFSAANAGAVFAYTKVAGSWTLQDTIEFTTPTANDKFGWAVSSDETGDTIVITSPWRAAGGTYRGEAYVFTRSGGVYSLIATLTPSDAADYKIFGHSAIISNDSTRIFIGAIDTSAAGTGNRGSIYVFKKPGGGWANTTEDQKLTASSPMDDDWFGVSGNFVYPFNSWAGKPTDCSVDGLTLVVGAYGRDTGGSNYGEVLVYKQIDGVYTLQQSLTPGESPESWSYYGWSVACNGDVSGVIVGAQAHSSILSYAGGAYMYWRDREATFELNGVINTNAKVLENVRSMLTSCRGMLPFIEGQFNLLIEKAEEAIFDFNKDNIIGGWSIKGNSKRNRLNSIKVKFINPDIDYQADYAVTSSDTYLTEDNDLVLEQELYLPHETSYSRALHRGETILKKSREGIQATFMSTIEALQVSTGSVVTVTHDTPGWPGKKFRVANMQLLPTANVAVTLVEHEDSVYDRTVSSAKPTPPDTNLPDPFSVVDPTGLSVDGSESLLIINSAGTVITRARITWAAPADVFVTRTEIEYKLSLDSIYMPQASAIGRENAQAEILGLLDGQNYDFRIRHVNGQGAVSNWVSTSAFIEGRSANPPDVLTFLVNRQADGTRQFDWTVSEPIPADVRVGGSFKIKYQTGLSGTWATMNDLLGAENLPPGIRMFETNQLAAGDYTFGIKMIDSSGNESENAVVITGTLGDPRIADAFEITNVFNDGWPGTKTNCYVDENGILTASNQDDWADRGAPNNWSNWTAWANNPYLTITYEHTYYDLGAIVSFTPLVSVSHNGTTLTVEERHKNNLGDAWSAYAAVGALVTARYVQIKITITKTSGVIFVYNTNIILSGEPIVEYINDLATSGLATCTPSPSCSTSGYRIAAGDIRLPIASNFSVIRKVNLTLQNVGGGWSWELIDKDVNVGPRVKIYNASSVLSDATIDAEIQGL
jgi:hypothetical protein